MSRSLKAAGLACLTVLAVAALGAPGAQGNVLHHFSVEEATGAEITGTGDPTDPVFKFFGTSGGTAIVCNQEHMEGTQSEETATTIEFTPTFTECEAFGFPATVTDNGCKFVFHAETTEDSKTTEEKGVLVENAPTDLNCGGINTHNIAIAVPALGCTIKYSDRSSGGATVNQSLHGVHFINHQTSGEPETVTAEVHVHAIHYEATGCGLGGIANGTHTTGTSIFKALWRAFKRLLGHVASDQINDRLHTT